MAWHIGELDRVSWGASRNDQAAGVWHGAGDAPVGELLHGAGLADLADARGARCGGAAVGALSRGGTGRDRARGAAVHFQRGTGGTRACAGGSRGGGPLLARHVSMVLVGGAAGGGSTTVALRDDRRAGGVEKGLGLGPTNLETLLIARFLGKTWGESGTAGVKINNHAYCIFGISVLPSRWVRGSARLLGLVYAGSGADSQ